MRVLGIGQSNIANHCGSPGRSSLGEVVFGGDVHPMSDPVPGGTGDLGSVWPRVAAELDRRGWADSFRLTLAASGGTSVGEWGPDGSLYAALVERLAGEDGRGTTHVVFQQGEKDTLLGTSEADYTRDFMRLYDGLADVVGDARWIICRSSYRFGVTSPDVVAAQTRLAATVPGAVAGPYLDELGPALRRDDTHFNDEGLARFAELLVDTLLVTAADRTGGLLP